MTTPKFSVNRAVDSQRSGNRSTPFGMKILTPLSSDSPMTPIRKSLFQKRRVTSNKRQKESFRAINELREDSKEVDNIGPNTSSKKKGGQLKSLRDRFNNIQKGLGSIDEERNNLVEKVKKLDREKLFIHQQLELRESEILTLIKRCASQEEKMRESSKLRSKNRELQNNLESVKKQLRGIEDNKQDRLNLEKKLQESELDRERLKDRLAQVQREHDSVTGTLQECLTKIRRLTEEKQALVEESRNERKRAEKEIEKLHLKHVDDSNTLKENLQAHQSRIKDMEKILQDNMKSNTALRREKAAMSQVQEKEIKELVGTYEEQLKELRQQLEKAAYEKEAEKELGAQELVAEIEMMREEIKSKDALIEGLESEFSDQMMTLMSKQSRLDEAEEEKTNLNSKVESLMKMEIEYAALVDFVEIMDSNLAEVTTTNAHLELEREELLEETDELRRKASLLEQQFLNMRNNNKAKEIDFRELLNTEKDELRKELEGSLKEAQIEILKLKEELETRNEYISTLETELDQARRLVSEKEEEILSITTEINSIRSNVGEDLKKARIEVVTLQAEVFAKDQQLASIEGHLEGAREIRELEEEMEEGNTFDTENNVIPSEDRTLQLHPKELQHQLEQTKELVDQKCSMHAQESVDDHVLAELPCTSLDELEERIRMLEKQLLEATSSRSESAANLRKAQERIEKLEKKLLENDARTISLQNQLRDATRSLQIEESKASFVEEEYRLHAQFRLESERNAVEALSKISALEGKIEEMSSQARDLQIRLRQSMEDIATKDEAITSVKVELAKSRVESEALRSRLEITCTEKRNLDILMGEKETELRMEIKETCAVLIRKEDRIKELEELVSKNEGSVEKLQELYDEAKDDIVLLEDEIQSQEKEVTTLTEEIRKLNQNSFLNGQELEQKVRDLTSELEKCNATLEKERESWIWKENSSNQEISHLRENLLELRESHAEREALITTLQEDLKARQIQISVAKNEVSDSANAISELQEELKMKEKTIEDLKQQMNSESEVQIGVNESEERRRKVEFELSQANEKIEELTTNLREREKELREVGDEKNENTIFSKSRCRVMEDEVFSLNEELKLREMRLQNTNNELETMKTDIQQKEQTIEALKASIQSLENDVQQIRNENDELSVAEEIAHNLKLELATTGSELAAKEKKLESLKEEMEIEKEHGMNLKYELDIARRKLIESQKNNDDLKLDFEDVKQGKKMLEVKLSEAKNEIDSLKSSSRKHISELESEISTLKINLTFKDEEILLEKKNAEELAKPLKEAINSLNEEFMREKSGRESDKKFLSSDIEALKSEIKMLSQKNESLSEECEKEIGKRTTCINALESSTQKLQCELNTLVAKIDDRDVIIQKLKEIISEGEKREETVRKDCDALKKSEQDLRKQLDNLQAEHELVARRDKEEMDAKLQSLHSGHRQEFEKTLSELRDVQRVLAERSSLLAEVVDHNRDIESKLKMEREKRLELEATFAEERYNVEKVRGELLKVQEERVRKQSDLESKLHEERALKEHAKQALKTLTAKYKETMRTERNMLDLEKENKELKDKINRQEAYLKRKLQKEKADRSRLTPRKSIGNPDCSTQRTPLKNMTNSSGKGCRATSTFTRSRLQAPSSISRRISTDIPVTGNKRRSNGSLSASSCRLLISPKSASTGSVRSTQLETPMKQTTPLSAQDILQFELDDDQSIGSELSLILR